MPSRPSGGPSVWYTSGNPQPQLFKPQQPVWKNRSDQVWSPFTLNIRSFFAPSARGLLLAVATLALTSCGQDLYPHPQYTYAGRPIPPSKLLQRVLVGVTVNGSQGNLQILDGLRDIRSNVQNTIPYFTISGYSGGYPDLIINYPAELRGYVYSNSDGSLATVNYSTEASSGPAASFGTLSTSVALAPSVGHIYSAEETNGQLVVADSVLGKTFSLNLPNVYKVVVNTGDTVALAMVRNSNQLYRVIKINLNQIYNPGATNPLFPPGAVDCEPYVLPQYCVVPVNGTFDRPANAYFSLDGGTAYIVNAGAEYGGGTNGGASISFLPVSDLTINTIPTSANYPVLTQATVPVPGGATDVLSDGNYLYIAGQSQQQVGGQYYWGGNLSLLNLSTMTVSAPIAISDGNHTNMLFADNNTLWIGSTACANGVRAALGENYNCLTMVNLNGTTTPTATIIPQIIPATATTPATVPYPNADENPLYLGSLTGICWVQNYGKVYTAYGGQIHAFYTADGSELNNYFITVQGSALTVAYMDALTDAAN